MGGTGEHRTRPEALRAGAGNVGGIILQAVSTVADLERMVLAPSSFAPFGSAVATASGALQAQQVTALRSLLSLLHEVNELVKHSADSVSQDNDPAPAGNRPPGAMWGSPRAAELARHAVADTPDPPDSAAGEPESVGNVLRYLTDTGMGELRTHPVAPTRFGGVADFNDWLGGDAENQARVGVVAVYSGTARGLGEVSSAVHDGDVVVVEPFATSGRAPFLGVAGDGRLYNRGRLDEEFRGLARVSVYRPARERGPA
jgi:hypothetical protein